MSEMLSCLDCIKKGEMCEPLIQLYKVSLVVKELPEVEVSEMGIVCPITKVHFKLSPNKAL